MNPGEVRAKWLLLSAATAVAVYLCWRMLQPFLSVLLWSSVLALLFWPVQKWLVRRTGRPAVAALLTLLLVLATVLVPIGLVTGMLVGEIAAVVPSAQQWAQHVAADLQEGGRLRALLERLPDSLQPDRFLSPEKVQDALGSFSQIFVVGTLNVVGGALGAIVNLFFILFTLFFLLRDGAEVAAKIPAILPVPRHEGEAIVERTREIIQASVYGVLVIAALQGFLGGAMFAILGIPSAIFWGVVMMLVSTLPVAGAFVIWIPAAIWLFADGRITAAIVLTAWGALLMGSVDNVLRPRLVGRKAKMHELTIFFSVLGGLKVFGVLGLLVGPVVFAITLALLDVFRRGDQGGESAPPAPAPNAAGSSPSGT
jgi:predicted PurR-regulated permease PerM